jgi:hypothetical protein
VEGRTREDWAEEGSSENAQMPFGPPDGGRADISVLNRHFVRFAKGKFGTNGLGMSDGDRQVRVIVGRKGVGKTLYMRRLQANAAKDDSLYADVYQKGVPRTSDVVKVCNFYPGAVNAEKWMGIWKAAILRSLVSHVVSSDRLGTNPELEIDLRENYQCLYPHFPTPHSITSQLTDILRSSKDGDELDAYIYHRDWESLSFRLGEALHGAPPVCFYVDAIDEEFRHAPHYWLMCQKGLFYQVMDFLTEDRIGGRLHVAICIRDHVFSATQMTEHATKYINSPYIRILNWRRQDIRYFLLEKLAAIDADWFVDPDDRTARGWLGVKEIYNPKREVTEDVESYLLRHTRLIPRDIVVLGNLICRRFAQREGEPLGEEEIRAVVKRAARAFGNEQLAITANQVAAEMMPGEAAALGYDNIYTGEDAEDYEGGYGFLDGLQRDIRELLETVRDDRFGVSKLATLKERFDEKFEDSCDVLSALWQNGLLGYTEGEFMTGDVVFYEPSEEDMLGAPLRKSGFALHPIMIDALDRIGGVGKPVEPGV